VISRYGRQAAGTIRLSEDLETGLSPMDYASWLIIEGLAIRGASKVLVMDKRLDRTVHLKEVIDATLESLAEDKPELANRIRGCLGDQETLVRYDLSLGLEPEAD